MFGGMFGGGAAAAEEKPEAPKPAEPKAEAPKPAAPKAEAPKPAAPKPAAEKKAAEPAGDLAAKRSAAVAAALSNLGAAADKAGTTVEAAVDKPAEAAAEAVKKVEKAAAPVGKAAEVRGLEFSCMRVLIAWSRWSAGSTRGAMAMRAVESSPESGCCRSLLPVPAVAQSAWSGVRTRSPVR